VNFANGSETSTEFRTLLETLWRRLDDTAQDSGMDLSSVELAIETPDGCLRLARDASGLRHLLVPVAHEDAVRDDRRSAGAHLIVPLSAPLLSRLVGRAACCVILVIRRTCRLPGNSTAPTYR